MIRLPIARNIIEEVIEQFGSPVFLYDEGGIRETAQALKNAFAWSSGYRNFFAVKALPIPGILRIVASEGMGMDCSSVPELRLATEPEWGLQLPGDRLMFTSNNTDNHQYTQAVTRGAIINIDALEHAQTFLEAFGPPERICFRYNAGDRVEGNDIIGKSVEVKYGLLDAQMLQAYRLLRDAGVKRFGLHAMLVSNQLSMAKLVENARLIFLMAAELHRELGIDFEFVNLGGGIGIDYRPDQQPVNLAELGEKIRQCYQAIFGPRGMSPTIYTECGRLVTGPHGYLITTVKNIKQLERTFIGVDTSVADILRTGMYEDAYHGIDVLGAVPGDPTAVYDVVCQLCENLKLAEQRELPVLAHFHQPLEFVDPVGVYEVVEILS